MNKPSPITSLFDTTPIECNAPTGRHYSDFDIFLMQRKVERYTLRFSREALIGDWRTVREDAIRSGSVEIMNYANKRLESLETEEDESAT